MKSRIAGIVIMILLASICLAGCSVELKEEEFYGYDENGEVKYTFDDIPDDGMITLHEGDYTYRKIGIESTREEVEKAYEDVGKLLEWLEDENGRVTGCRIETDYGILGIGFDEQDKISYILMKKAKASLSEEKK